MGITEESTTNEVVATKTVSKGFIKAGLKPPVHKASWISLFLKGHVPLNRYIVLGLLVIMCMTTGPMHFNWPPLRRLFERSGAYAWLCLPAGQVGSFELTIEADGTCPAQKTAIARIFSVLVAVQFTSPLISGQLADRLSPKIVAMWGLILQLTGWMLMINGSQKFQGYLLGAVLDGFGQDLSFLPLFAIRGLFPGKEGLVISLLGTGRSLSSFIPIILDRLSQFFGPQNTWLVGILILQIYAMLVVYIAVPWEKYWCNIPQKISQSLSVSVAEISETDNDKSVEIVQIKRKKSVLLKAELSTLAKQLSSLVFILYIPFVINAITRPIWMSLISADVLKQGLGAFELAAALSFIPCPIFGYLTDKYGILVVLHIVNLFGALMIGCAIVVIQAGFGNAAWAQFCVAVTYAIIQSFVLSQVYCYVQQMFPPKDTGKIVGLFCAIAGVTSLAVEPLYTMSLQSGFLPVTIFFLVFAIFCEFLVIALQIIRRKQNKTAPKSLNVV